MPSRSVRNAHPVAGSSAVPDAFPPGVDTCPARGHFPRPARHLSLRAIVARQGRAPSASPQRCRPMNCASRCPGTGARVFPEQRRSTPVTDTRGCFHDPQRPWQPGSTEKYQWPAQAVVSQGYWLAGHLPGDAPRCGTHVKCTASRDARMANTCGECHSKCHVDRLRWESSSGKSAARTRTAIRWDDKTSTTGPGGTGGLALNHPSLSAGGRDVRSCD